MISVQSQLALIQNAFAIEHLPANVRLSRRLARIPVARRFSSAVFGAGGIPANGVFLYRCAGTEKKIAFDGRNFQFHALYEPGYQAGYELESAVLMMLLCRGGGAFFDIGSNWGYFPLLLASSPEFTGPIFAFEPNPRTFHDLTSVLRQSGTDSRVTALNFGVGKTVCQMGLEETDRFKTGLARLSDSGGGMKISVKPLDGLNLPAPLMLKIDAEGMEADVLAGAARTLEDVRPFVLVENFSDPLNPKRTCQPIEILKSCSYRLFAPVLLFRNKDCLVPAPYGSDFAGLLKCDSKPELGLFGVTRQNRFLLPQQLNLLAVHSAKVPELWDAGMVDLDRQR